jgi:plasmid stability protein
MAQVLINDVEPDVLMRLERRAAKRGVTLETELRRILRRAVESDTRPEPRAALLTPEIERIQAMFDGRVQPDSTEYVREDRDR